MIDNDVPGNILNGYVGKVIQFSNIASIFIEKRGDNI